MNIKPTYENLEQKVRDLETSIQQYKSDGYDTDHSDSVHNASYLLTALMNHTKDYILISDEKGKPLIFNAAYAKLMKEVLDLDMKPGIQPHKLLDDPEAVNYWDQLHKRALGGERFQEEYTHEISKDNIRTFEVSFTPIKENDQITGFVELTRDITERKQSQQALIMSQQKVIEYLDVAGVIILALDRDGNINLINKHGLKILGYRRKELLGKNWFKTCLPDRLQKDVLDVYSQLVRGENKPFEYYENQIRRKDGEERIISWYNAVLRNSSGDITGTLSSGEDITERKKIETELRLKNSVFEAAITGNSTADKNGILRHVNNSFTIIWGYENKKEVIGKPIGKFLKFEDEANKIIISLNETGKWEGEYTALKKDGTTFVAYGLGTTITDESGDVIGYQSSVLDISEQKLAEEALRESEEKYRGIFENAVEGFFQSTPEGRFTSVNPAFASMFGYGSPEELISDISDISEEYYVNPEDRQRYKRLLEKNGSVDHFEFKARCKDGSQIWVTDSTRAIYDANGKITRYEGNVNDITERKQAEKALRESEAKYRSMMDAMIDTVYICSPDYRVEYMNPAMINRIGRDATGEYCYKAIHDLDQKCPFCVHDVIKQNIPVESDVFSEKDYRSYRVSHSPILHEDGSISKMMVYRDTTEFKKMETQLRQAQKMEAIGTLAGGVAHDFNNILFPMFGYLEMMLQDVPEGNPLRSHLAEVFNGAKRARDLVKQILTFSRQQDHNLKPLKVHPVIKEALKLIKSSLPSTIEIAQNIKSDCGVVFADPTQVHQIVMNLCTNAYHAMEKKGGKLSVNLKEVELTAEELKAPAMVPGPYVCLTVADTGPGMKQVVIDRIFDPYFSTKEKGKGTGLGLAVVDGIVKSHGGHISVYSEPGRGTEFKVYLPVIKHQETTQRVETGLSIKKGDERILLVDDQELIADMEKQMLERMGYQVTARISSTDALEAFRAKPDNFDLVITDFTMPNMTGDKLAEALIKIRSDIPVLLCTGFSEIMSKERAAALGIKGFLMKPVVMKELSNAIRKVLDDK